MNTSAAFANFIDIPSSFVHDRGPRQIGVSYLLPYRIDIADPPSGALDVLVKLGALDVETWNDGIAVLLPDSVTPQIVAGALGGVSIAVSPAVARDSGSVWLLSPRAARIGSLLVAPTDVATSAKALRLTDSAAFGTGHHPTTALCIEEIAKTLATEHFDSILDVGTGSGILALAALIMGVPQAVGVDIDAESLGAAAKNARLNDMTKRLQLVLGGPGDVEGLWPLIVANVLAAPLIGMAPVLVQRLASRGRLILSGISWSLEPEVRSAYQRFGIRQMSARTRDGWTVLMGQASW